MEISYAVFVFFNSINLMVAKVMNLVLKQIDLVAIPEARLLVQLKAIDSLTGKKEKTEEKLSETIKATKVTGDLWLNVKMTLQLSSRVEAFRKQFITREPLKVYIIKCKGYEEGKSNDDSDA
ncbi:hypothetical protein Tco_0877980 [Tanacetum coccineum]|uniref:Uncharacterized protein n=1 Tax=Tanacetum coccineum TaxID=301880 RepID=A0ABQ5C1Y7_9ASTR